jgi:hypothetical protein
MSSRTHCDQLTDHPTHPVTYGRNQLTLYLCPGRFTPSAHRAAPTPEIAYPADPFDAVDAAFPPSVWD